MITSSPSISIVDGASSSSWASSSGAKRSRGSARFLNSSVSAMRPTRSISLTIRNFALHRRAVGVLRVAELVLDHLDHVRIRRQGEDVHHEAAGSRAPRRRGPREWCRWWRRSRMKSVLPCFAEPDHRVELGARLRRHQRLQELHVARRHVHVDHEVRPRELEEHARCSRSRRAPCRARAGRRRRGARRPRTASRRCR